MLNVVDTSAWLAFFAGTDNADIFQSPITDTENLIVPSICIYELSKVILRESDEDHLLPVLATLQKGQVVTLDPVLATAAAKNSLHYKLPMADSIIFTTAQQYNALVWTQDNDFQHLPNVKYFMK